MVDSKIYPGKNNSCYTCGGKFFESRNGSVIEMICRIHAHLRSKIFAPYI